MRINLEENWDGITGELDLSKWNYFQYHFLLFRINFSLALIIGMGYALPYEEYVVMFLMSSAVSCTFA
jgi:hypothetical protein